MKLMFAALIRASQTWRGIPINESERRQLDQLRAERDQQFDERHAVPLTSQSRSRISSNQGLDLWLAASCEASTRSCVTGA